MIGARLSFGSCLKLQLDNNHCDPVFYFRLPLPPTSRVRRCEEGDVEIIYLLLDIAAQPRTYPSHPSAFVTYDPSNQSPTTITLLFLSVLAALYPS